MVASSVLVVEDTEEIRTLVSTVLERAGLQVGDVIVKVNGHTIATMIGLYRTAWSVGDAGVDISMTLLRETYAFELALKSEDRYSRLKFQRG